MSAVVKPAFAREAGFGVIVTRCPTAPCRATLRTPSILLSSGTTFALSAAARAFTSPLLVTASWSTGRSSIDPLMTCGSTPVGRVARIRLIACVTFCSVATRSVPYLKVADTTDELVLEVAVLESSPAMPWMADSIGTETSSFTTSGEAPG